MLYTFLVTCSDNLRDSREPTPNTTKVAHTESKGETEKAPEEPKPELVEERSSKKEVQ